MFFRAGILGRMEELRDDRISLLLAWLQAWIRGYLSRKSYQKLQKQRICLLVVQRNIRKYMKMRTWKWYGFWMVLKPTLHVVSIEDELRALEEKAEKAEKEYEKMIKKHEELKKINDGLNGEKNELQSALDSSKGGAQDFIDKINKLQAQRNELEAQVNVSNGDLYTISHKKSTLEQIPSPIFSTSCCIVPICPLLNSSYYTSSLPLLR